MTVTARRYRFRFRRAPAKSNSMLMIGGVVLVVVVAWRRNRRLLLLRSKTTRRSGGPGASPTPVCESERSNDASKPTWLRFRAEPFRWAATMDRCRKRPTHPMTVQSFFMDKTEVTNAEYAEFVRDTHYAPPQDWNGDQAALRH